MFVQSLIDIVDSSKASKFWLNFLQEWMNVELILIYSIWSNIVWIQMLSSYRIVLCIQCSLSLGLRHLIHISILFDSKSCDRSPYEFDSNLIQFRYDRALFNFCSFLLDFYPLFLYDCINRKQMNSNARGSICYAKQSISSDRPFETLLKIDPLQIVWSINLYSLIKFNLYGRSLAFFASSIQIEFL